MRRLHPILKVSRQAIRRAGARLCLSADSQIHEKLVRRYTRKQVVKAQKSDLYHSKKQRQKRPFAFFKKNY